MKVTVCQLDPDATDHTADLREHMAPTGTDVLLLPEMPFFGWLPAVAEPDAGRWASAAAAHEQRIARLDELGAGSVLGTRPIVTATGSRRNQAFLWTTGNPAATPVHDKHYLPDEAGYWEATWYDRGPATFETARAGAAVLGVQICTEMWFFEWARSYARAGVDLLCVPRATPRASLDRWLAGGRAAAVSAGAYCVSSNLWMHPGPGADCGGMGWVVDPDGEVLAVTSEDEPVVTVDVDLDVARRAKATYPRYVAE